MGQAGAHNSHHFAAEDAPSMEEILLSIRSVIAGIAENTNRTEQQKTPTGTSQPTQPQPFAMPPIEDDVLELTDIAEDPDTAVRNLEAAALSSPNKQKNSPTPAKAKDDSGLSVVQQIDKAVRNANTKKPFQPEAQEPVFSAPESSDGLLDGEALNKTAHSLQGLINKLRKEQTPASGAQGQKTVEELVTETLRPYLTEWINQHLPVIVERIVEREIKKIVEQYVA